jgi:hypothetical protein
MKEVKRIKKLMKDLYNGEPWLDVTIDGKLREITAAQAAFKFNPGINSIWEITNHMIWWRLNIIERLCGKIINTPEHNYFLAVTDDSEDAWIKTLERFELSQHEWMLFMKGFKRKHLDIIYPANGFSFYDHLIGIIQHDAYHLGQIVLLAKHFTPAPAAV